MLQTFWFKVCSLLLASLGLVLPLYAQDQASLIIWCYDETLKEAGYELHLYDPATQEDTLVMKSDELFWINNWTSDGTRAVLSGIRKEGKENLVVLDWPSGELSVIPVGMPVYRPTISPDGQHVVFEGYGLGGFMVLYLYTFETNHLERLTETVDVDEYGAHWSPDSQLIAYKAVGDIWIITLGQEPRSVPEWTGIISSWTPDSTSLLLQEDDGLALLFDVTNGTIMPLLLCESENGYEGYSWRPDGSLICSIYDAATDTTEFRLLDLEANEATVIGHLSGMILEFSLSPSGDHLMYGYGSPNPKFAFIPYHTQTQQLSDMISLDVMSAQWRPVP
jgi:hypothetical protein